MHLTTLALSINEEVRRYFVRVMSWYSTASQPILMHGALRRCCPAHGGVKAQRFKSVIEGYLAPVFARAEVVENRTYRLEGTLEEPQMIAENRAR